MPKKRHVVSKTHLKICNTLEDLKVPRPLTSTIHLQRTIGFKYNETTEIFKGYLSSLAYPLVVFEAK